MLDKSKYSTAKRKKVPWFFQIWEDWHANGSELYNLNILEKAGCCCIMIFMVGVSRLLRLPLNRTAVKCPLRIRCWPSCSTLTGCSQSSVSLQRWKSSLFFWSSLVFRTRPVLEQSSYQSCWWEQIRKELHSRGDFLGSVVFRNEQELLAWNHVKPATLCCTHGSFSALLVTHT